MSSNTHTFLKGISHQTIITVGLGLLELFYFSMMSRLLTKVEFGYFASLMALVGIFNSLSEAGLGASIIQRKSDSSSHINTAFSLGVISGLSFSILLYLLAPLLSELISDSADADVLTAPLRMMSVLLLLNSINSIGRSILIRSLRFMTAGLVQITAYCISIGIAIWMALRGYGVFALVANSIIYALLATIGNFIFIKNRPRLEIRKQNVKEVVNFGGWLTLGVIFNNITHQVDKIVLPRLLSYSALGAYNRPAGFVSTISVQFNSIFDTVLFPMLSKIQENKNTVVEVFDRSVSLLNTFSVLLASAFCFNASLIIDIFFGSKWESLVPVLQIISISVVFNINGRLCDCFFRSLNYVKQNLVLRIISFCVILGCVVAGSHWDVIGVATGIVIGNFICNFMKIFYLSHKISSNILKVCLIWLESWKACIPFATLYIVYSLFVSSKDWITDISLAATMVVTLIILMLFFPGFLGTEYKHNFYPMIKSKLKLK